MTEDAHAELRPVVRALAEKIRKWQDRRIGEQNTKAALIEPVLEGLGWDIRDWDEVHREFKAKARDKPVDYALKCFRTPRLFIEAKALGQDLGDRKWIAQVLGYATVAGVEWCVLTDGDEYRFYNAAAPVDAEEKLFRRVRISEGKEDEAVSTLALLSRSNLDGNLLEGLWAAHFVDRRVKAVLRDLLNPPDKGLVRLIHRRAPQLKPKEIAASIARLDIRIGSPTRWTGAAPSKPATSGQAGGKRKGPKGRPGRRVTLADVIAAGILRPPVKLCRKYKGQMMEATLLPGGGVAFQGTRYETCSAAAASARSTVTGKKMSTNGWCFWQTRDADGGLHELREAKAKYLEQKRQE